MFCGCQHVAEVDLISKPDCNNRGDAFLGATFPLLPARPDLLIPLLAHTAREQLEVSSGSTAPSHCHQKGAAAGDAAHTSPKSARDVKEE